MARNSGWVTNQHGAWAMLALPFLVGTVRGISDHGFRAVTVALLGLWFLGYFAYFAAGLWLKSNRRPRYLRPMATYTAAAGVCAILVLALDPRLVACAPVFVPLLALGLWASARRTERSVLAGVAMVAAASLMTPVAYAACLPGNVSLWGGLADGPTPLAAVTGFIFVQQFGTLLYVKSMIRERGVRAYAVLSVGFHVAGTFAAVPLAVFGDATWWWAVAFLALMTARAWIVRARGRSLTPRTVGLAEALSVVGAFAVALVVQ